MRNRHRSSSTLTSLFKRYGYVILVLVAFAIMFVGRADTPVINDIRAKIVDVFAPIIDVASTSADAVGDVMEEAQQLSELREENARLREERERLLEWREAALRLETENDKLKELLNYAPEPEARYITVRVIAETGGAFSRNWVLNVGKRDGIRKGQALLSGQGLVGRVHTVGLNSARVLLITDVSSRISVFVGKNRVRAMLAGDNTNFPKLIFLPIDATVKPGERVVTSGAGGAFPAGIPVGEVADVREKEIRVRPYGVTSSLEYVRAVDYGLQGIVDLSQDSGAPMAGPGDHEEGGAEEGGQ